MQPTPVDELPYEQTAFQGVLRIRPGTIVEFGMTGEVAKHTYWDLASRIGRTDVTTLEQAGEGFAALLRQAVQQRVPQGELLASHLSGGMDSSSIVCLVRTNCLPGEARPFSHCRWCTGGAAWPGSDRTWTWFLVRADR